MYKIIGADRKEYGPITAEQMQQWIAEGRVNSQTLVWSETSGNWKPLSTYPELAGQLAPGTPPTGTPPTGAPYSYGGDRTGALEKVNGPAIGLFVTAGLGLLGAIAGIAMNLLGVGMGASGMGGGAEAQWAQMMSGTVGIIGNVLGIIVSIVIFLGANKMRKLESYGFSMAASIIAMVPCISPCCLVGLPIGIWAIVVLNKPEVKSQFQ